MGHYSSLHRENYFWWWQRPKEPTNFLFCLVLLASAVAPAGTIGDRRMGFHGGVVEGYLRGGLRNSTNGEGRDEQGQSGYLGGLLSSEGPLGDELVVSQ